jgi:hypothetical protein
MTDISARLPSDMKAGVMCDGNTASTGLVGSPGIEDNVAERLTGFAETRKSLEITAAVLRSLPKTAIVECSGSC